MKIRSPNTLEQLNIGIPLKEYLTKYLNGNIVLPKETSDKRRLNLFCIKPKFCSSKIKSTPACLHNISENDNFDFKFHLHYGNKQIDLAGKEITNESQPFSYNISTDVNRYRENVGNFNCTYYNKNINSFFEDRLEYITFRNILDNFDDTIGITENNLFKNEQIKISFPGGQYWDLEADSLEKGVNFIYHASIAVESFLEKREKLLHKEGKRIAKEVLDNCFS